MPQDRFLIAPLETGLVTAIRPWLVPDDAFASINNAYVFRGRVVKRFGSKKMPNSVAAPYDNLSSRLRINIGTTDGGTGNKAGTVPGAVFAVGQMFSIGSQIFTVTTAGAAQAMLSSNGVSTGTFSTTNGAFVITGNAANPATVIYWYPAQPVLGFLQYANNVIQSSPVYAFDTQFAYQYIDNVGWDRLVSGGGANDIWRGTNLNFYWGATWQGATPDINILYVTNFSDPTLQALNAMRYWDGTNWNVFRPATSSVANNYMDTAKIIIPFKNRLLAFNTIETVSGTPSLAYKSRCRFSQNGGPISASSWYSDTPGLGGWIDAPTQEAIVTVQLIRDRMIVYFETSTWELVYNGNQLLPFGWQQLDSSLGVQSTFSIVQFDNTAIGMGNTGIHACNGGTVQRIDDKIPQQIFDFNGTNNDPVRVYGIRDFKNELIYWAYSKNSDVSPYNDQVLVFNYKNGTWAVNNDSYTCFGYFFPTITESETWGSTYTTWEDNNDLWGTSSSLAPLQQVIIGGNQQGWTTILDADQASNADALSITNIAISQRTLTITCIDHNVNEDGFVQINNCIGLTLINGYIFQATNVTSNTFTVEVPGFLGALTPYLGNGTIALITPISIFTKQYNFYNQAGVNISIDKVDFLVDRTSLGVVSVDILPSSFSSDSVNTKYLQTYPYALISSEQYQDRLWHSIYPNAQGNCVQLVIGNTAFCFNDEANQIMADPNIVNSDFEMHAMLFYTSKTSSRFQ